MIAYLGVPLRSREGHVLGALCAIDTQPRAWSPEDLEMVREVAAAVEGEIHMGAERRDHANLQQIVASHHDVHDMTVAGAPLAETLDALVRGVEQQSDGMLASILLCDAASGTLTHGAAPSLPVTYREALDGLAIGPDAGSCGTAAHYGEEVIVEDVLTDPRWLGYRRLASAHGVRASWSVPILGADDEVVGTFALYDRDPRAPTTGELKLVRHASALAGIAIQRHRARST